MDIKISTWTKETMDALKAPVQSQDQIFPPVDATSSLWFVEIVTILQILSLLCPLQYKLNLIYEFVDLNETSMVKAKAKYEAVKREEAQLETQIAEGRVRIEDLRQEIERIENDLAAANQSNSSPDHSRDALMKVSELYSEAVELVDLGMSELNRVIQVKMSTADIVDRYNNVISVGKLELIKLIKDTILLLENKMTDAVLDLVLEWNRSRDKSTISNEEA